VTKGSDPTAESYNVFVCYRSNGQNSHCSRKGYEAHRTCKHLDSANALIDNGWLPQDRINGEQEVSNTEPPFYNLRTYGVNDETDYSSVGFAHPSRHTCDRDGAAVGLGDRRRASLVASRGTGIDGPIEALSLPVSDWLAGFESPRVPCGVDLTSSLTLE
jgi:hypothetical protein